MATLGPFISALALVGPVRIWFCDQPMSLPAGKPRALAALLATQPTQEVSTDAIVGSLWGESPPATATGAVQVYVSALRRALLDCGAEARSVLRTASAGYLLDVDKAAVDSVRFERAARDGIARLRAGDFSTARLALSEGLDEWQGARACRTSTSRSRRSPPPGSPSCDSLPLRLSAPPRSSSPSSHPVARSGPRNPVPHVEPELVVPPGNTGEGPTESCIGGRLVHERHGVGTGRPPGVR